MCMQCHCACVWLAFTKYHANVLTRCTYGIIQTEMKLDSINLARIDELINEKVIADNKNKMNKTNNTNINVLVP